MTEISYKPEWLQAFGLLEVRWNEIESILFLIFSRACGARLPKAHAIYFSHQNHRARREMLEKVAYYTLVRRRVLAKRFNSLMRRTGNAAQRRNQAIHTLWQWENGDPVPMWPVDNPFVGKNVMTELMTVARTISALYDDLVAFYVKMPGGLRSSPRFAG